MNYIFTVDVEEYYHAENIQGSFTKKIIPTFSSRIEIGIRKLLHLLSKHGSKATFFTLGCVAENNKNLIKEIIKEGHEIASHGYLHKPLANYSPESFEADFKKTKDILENITSQQVVGYRAMNFSLEKKEDWFFHILEKYKFVYDSSICPSLFRKSKLYNAPNKNIYKIYNNILEIPIAFINIGPVKIPLGGGYFRVLPVHLSTMLLRQKCKTKDCVRTFYIHPWELDPEQPKMAATGITSFRHYCNLAQTEKKIDIMLKTIRFSSIKKYLENEKY